MRDLHDRQIPKSIDRIARIEEPNIDRPVDSIAETNSGSISTEQAIDRAGIADSTIIPDQRVDAHVVSQAVLSTSSGE